MNVIERVNYSSEEEEREPLYPEMRIGDISRLKGEERKGALAEFKRNLNEQKIGLAKMQEAIIEAIRENPDIDRDDIALIISEFRERYLFADWQVDAAEKIFREYARKHKNVQKNRLLYPDDKELFLKLFGALPAGKVKFEEGPMTLYARCSDPRDFALIYSGKNLSPLSLSQDDIDLANKADGCALPYSRIDGLNGCVLAESSKPHFNDTTRRQIRVHEEQHALNKLFRDRWNQFDSSVRYSSILDSSDETEKEQKIKRWLRTVRKTAEGLVKDEIIAYLKMRPPYGADDYVYQTLIKSQKNGGLYDYLTEVKKDCRRRLSADATELEGIEIKIIIEDIFTQEYREIIRAGIEAFMSLTKIGFSSEQVIGILAHEPLIKWPKVVRRIARDGHLAIANPVLGGNVRYDENEGIIIDPENKYKYRY